MNEGTKLGIGLCVVGGLLFLIARVVGALLVVIGLVVIGASVDSRNKTIRDAEESLEEFRKRHGRTQRYKPKPHEYHSQFEHFKKDAERKNNEMIQRIKEAEFSAVETMTGLEFENWCALLLQKNGYEKVEVTPASGDHGVDVIAEKDGERYAFQCKRYKKPVGFSAVKEVYTGKALYKSDRAIIMTTSTFTDQARRDAKKLNVELWDRKVLLEMNHEGNKTSERIVAS